jgi:ketosteroid isomerase-like protein
MASGSSEQTGKTLLHHMKAFGAGDVDAIMTDYTEDAVLIMPDGTVKGHAQIRSLFTQLFVHMFPPASTTINLAKQVIEGEVAYILWSGGSTHFNVPRATETFVVRGGKIIAQTFAAQMEKK